MMTTLQNKVSSFAQVRDLLGKLTKPSHIGMQAHFVGKRQARRAMEWCFLIRLYTHADFVRWRQALWAMDTRKLKLILI